MSYLQETGRHTNGAGVGPYFFSETSVFESHEEHFVSQGVTRAATSVFSRFEQRFECYGSPRKRKFSVQRQEIHQQERSPSERLHDLLEAVSFNLLSKANFAAFSQDLSEIVASSSELSPPEKIEIEKLLFLQKIEGYSFFEATMSHLDKESANHLFDSLIAMMTQNGSLREITGTGLSKEQETVRNQLMQFAYSQHRYQYLWMNAERDFNPGLMQRVQELKEESDSSSEGSSPPPSPNFQSTRMRSMSSLVADSRQQNTQVNWLQADETFKEAMKKPTKKRVSPLSASYPLAIAPNGKLHLPMMVSEPTTALLFGEETLPFSREELAEMIKNAHATLAKDEIDVENPGKLRTGPVCAGGNFGTCVPPHLLREHFARFCHDLSIGFNQCDQGRKNPIIFASEMYQRLISIHPFENANGRVARVMMDGILSRYGLPPVSFREKTLAGVFPLQVMEDKSQFHSDFLQGVLDGMQLSLDLIKREA